MIRERNTGVVTSPGLLDKGPVFMKPRAITAAHTGKAKLALNSWAEKHETVAALLPA